MEIRFATSEKAFFLPVGEKVLIKSSDREFNQRNVSDSLGWEQGKPVDKKGRDVIYSYSIPAREVKIGESIYNEDGSFRAYRSN